LLLNLNVGETRNGHDVAVLDVGIAESFRIPFDEELQNGYPSRVCKGSGEVGYAIPVVSKGFGFRKFRINRNNTIDMFVKQILLLTIT